MTISIQISEHHSNQQPWQIFFTIFRSKSRLKKYLKESAFQKDLIMVDKGFTVNPVPGGLYTLDFGPGYIWKAVVTEYVKDSVFELKMTEADADWLGTKIGFILITHQGRTEVNFYHTGWPKKNEHYKISSYCWAMYLRILKRYLEFGRSDL